MMNESLLNCSRRVRDEDRMLLRGSAFWYLEGVRFKGVESGQDFEHFQVELGVILSLVV
jgi:hypothetical protein